MHKEHKSEQRVKQELLLKLGSRPDIRLFRNNVGMAYMGSVVDDDDDMITLKGRRVVKFGLHKGSGDLIGWKSVTITQDMVGKKFAQFLSVEVKRPGGRRSSDQETWYIVVSESGGIAIVADDAASVDV